MSSLQSRFSACRMQQKSSGSPSPSNPIIVFSPQKFELRCGRSSPWRTVVWRHPCALEASAPPPPFPRGVGGVPPSKRDPRCIDGIGVHTWRESSSRPVFGAIRCVQSAASCPGDDGRSVGANADGAPLQKVVGQAHAATLRDRFDGVLAVCVESAKGQFGSFPVAQVHRDFAPCMADDQFTAEGRKSRCV